MRSKIRCDGESENFSKIFGITNWERNRRFLIVRWCTHTAVMGVRLPAVDTLKRYSKALEYEYRVKTAALGTLKRYSILSLTLYLE
jgi:hypothetical protein